MVRINQFNACFHYIHSMVFGWLNVEYGNVRGDGGWKTHKQGEVSSA